MLTAEARSGKNGSEVSSEEVGARVGGGRWRAAVLRAVEAASAVLDDGGGAGAGVVVDAVVGGDDVAGVVAVPLHALLHAAALRRAPVVVPARVPATTPVRNSESREKIFQFLALRSIECSWNLTVSRGR